MMHLLFGIPLSRYRVLIIVLLVVIRTSTTLTPLSFKRFLYRSHPLNLLLILELQGLFDNLSI